MIRNVRAFKFTNFRLFGIRFEKTNNKFTENEERRLQCSECTEYLYIPIEHALSVQVTHWFFVPLESVESHRDEENPEMKFPSIRSRFAERLDRSAHVFLIEEISKDIDTDEWLLMRTCLPIKSKQRVNYSEYQQGGVNCKHNRVRRVEDLGEEIRSEGNA